MPDHLATDEAPAFKIARALLEGFDRHYRLFSETNRAAKQRFEQADWNLHKQRILAGEMLDVFPYEPQRRFVNQRQAGAPELAAASP